jgi:hypothetical protein
MSLGISFRSPQLVADRDALRALDEICPDPRRLTVQFDVLRAYEKRIKVSKGFAPLARGDELDLGQGQFTSG